MPRLLYPSPQGIIYNSLVFISFKLGPTKNQNPPLSQLPDGLLVESLPEACSFLPAWNSFTVKLAPSAASLDSLPNLRDKGGCLKCWMKVLLFFISEGLLVFLSHEFKVFYKLWDDIKNMLRWLSLSPVVLIPNDTRLERTLLISSELLSYLKWQPLTHPS